LKFLGRFFSVFFLCFLAFQAKAQFYNGSQMTFGKNRLQFNEFLWQFYRYEHYDVYFYLGGKELAIYTAKTAEKSLLEIQKRFDYSIDERLQFIVYNKLSDLRQSNIGLSTDITYNTGGMTHIVDCKMVLYFDGDHRHFEEQIRAGIAQVMVNKMMFGGNIRDVVRNTAFLSLPEWYQNGLISYISKDWNSEIENKVKDGILSGKYGKMNRLQGEDATYAGHSLWNYVAETYGKSVISDIIYMTRVSRNVESGFLFVLGVSLKNITLQWLDFYDNNYFEPSKKLEAPEGTNILKRTRKGRVYQNLKLSPDGQKAAYVSNDMGLYRIYLKNLSQKKRPKKVFKQEYRSIQKTDLSFPPLSWHPGGQLLAWIWEKKGLILLSLYNLETRKTVTRPLKNFDKILDFSYSDDGKKFVLSAVQFGQSDIFIYDIISNTYLQVTKDSWDDLYPRFINNSKDVVFSSNRTNDTLKAKDSSIVHRDASLDLFIYNYSTRNSVLKRVSNTHFADEIMATPYDSAHFSYISDGSGTQNRYLARMDSVVSFVDTITHYRWFTTAYPVTNYPRNLLQMDVAPKAGVLGEIYYQKGKYRLFTNPVKNENAKEVRLGAAQFKLKQERLSQKDQKKKKQEDIRPAVVEKPKEIKAPEPQFPENKLKLTEVDIDNYVFSNETFVPKRKNQPEPPKEVSRDTTGQNTAEMQANLDRMAKKKEKERQKHSTNGLGEDTITFRLAKQRVYELRFSTDYVVTQLDNSFTGISYQKFTGGAIYYNPGINGMFKLGASDLFEDYKITGGFRIAANLNSNEYFLSWQNLKKRLDKQVLFNRQTFKNGTGTEQNKIQTHTLSYILKYPFTENSALKATILGRTDRTVYLGTNETLLRKPNETAYLAGLKLEYIFDNTISRGLNLYQGARYKIFAEYYNSLKNSKDYFTVFGADFRHYTRLHRDLIWANRFAGSTSLGPEKLIYYLGGVDNWISPKFDKSIPISQTENYQYQALATNMRGFFQNVRNGNSFMAINSEVRWPIFRYLVNRPLKSDFLNNFQLIGFGDVGTAWNGLTPYSDKNAFNTKVITNGTLTIKLKNTSDPIVYGFGLGARTRILGYFIRVDYAWGVVDGLILKPQLYISLSTDF
jgi:Tol biopolymer transport system component